MNERSEDSTTPGRDESLVSPATDAGELGPARDVSPSLCCYCWGTGWTKWWNEYQSCAHDTGSLVMTCPSCNGTGKTW